MGLGNKQIMAANIKKYMRQKGVSASTVCQDLDIAMATFSDWCNAKTYPRIDKIEQLANYFNIRKSQLVEEWDDIVWDASIQEVVRSINSTAYENYYIEKFRTLTEAQKETVLDMIDMFVSKNRKE